MNVVFWWKWFLMKVVFWRKRILMKLFFLMNMVLMKVVFTLQQTFMWSISGLQPAMLHMKACWNPKSGHKPCLCEGVAGLSRRGASKTPPKFHERTPREGRKERILRREGKKARNFGPPHPSGPPPSGPPPSSPPPSGPPPLTPYPFSPHVFQVWAPYPASALHPALLDPCFFCPECIFLFCPPACLLILSPFPFFLSRCVFFCPGAGVLDESLIGWNRFWMNVSVDEIVFGWKCIPTSDREISFSRS